MVFYKAATGVVIRHLRFFQPAALFEIPVKQLYLQTKMKKNNV